MFLTVFCLILAIELVSIFLKYCDKKLLGKAETFIVPSSEYEYISIEHFIYTFLMAPSSSSYKLIAGRLFRVPGFEHDLVILYWTAVESLLQFLKCMLGDYEFRREVSFYNRTPEVIVLFNVLPKEAVY